MKFKTVFKTVMFYGNVIYLNEEYNWLAVDEDGEIKAFMEKPFTGYGVWNTDSLGICAFSPTMELEGYDWKDTLTYCKKDQGWMISVAAKLDIANTLYSDSDSHKVMRTIIEAVADTIRGKAKNKKLRATFNALIKHALPTHLQSSAVVDMLRYNLFLKKEPEHCVVKYYYGAEVVVPECVKFIAMDSDGRVWGYEEQPEMNNVQEGWTTKGDGKVYNVGWRGEKIGNMEWLDSLREVQKCNS